jgi:peroxiredoxin
MQFPHRGSEKNAGLAEGGKAEAMKSLAFLCLAFALGFAQGSESPNLPEVLFPEKVRDVDGQNVDVAKLAKKKKLVVITLKATWCEVCQHQLYRIKKKLAESRACGLTYLVLAPGPKKDLQAIQKAVGFPFPFVEDEGLRIAESLGLRMGEDEIFPSIFILNADRTVGWMQAGRGEGQYGDPALFEAIRCAEWI